LPWASVYRLGKDSGLAECFILTCQLNVGLLHACFDDFGDGMHESTAHCLVMEGRIAFLRHTVKAIEQKASAGTGSAGGAGARGWIRDIVQQLPKRGASPIGPSNRRTVRIANMNVSGRVDTWTLVSCASILILWIFISSYNEMEEADWSRKSAIGCLHRRHI